MADEYRSNRAFTSNVHPPNQRNQERIPANTTPQQPSRGPNNPLTSLSPFSNQWDPLLQSLGADRPLNCGSHPWGRAQAPFHATLPPPQQYSPPLPSQHPIGQQRQQHGQYGTNYGPNTQYLPPKSAPWDYQPQNFFNPPLGSGSAYNYASNHPFLANYTLNFGASQRIQGQVPGFSGAYPSHPAGYGAPTGRDWQNARAAQQFPTNNPTVRLAGASGGSGLMLRSEEHPGGGMARRGDGGDGIPSWRRAEKAAETSTVQPRRQQTSATGAEAQSKGSGTEKKPMVRVSGESKSRDGYKRGQVRHLRGGRMQFWESDVPDKAPTWRDADYHHNWRRELLQLDNATNAPYVYAQEKGDDVDDVTGNCNVANQHLWDLESVQGRSLVRDLDDNHVFLLDDGPSLHWPMSAMNPQKMMHRGLILLDVDCNPVMDYPHIPRCLSSQLSGVRLEALRRCFTWITVRDLRARMPIQKFEGPIDQFGCIRLSALRQRQTRWRNKNGVKAYNPESLPQC